MKLSKSKLLHKLNAVGASKHRAIRWQYADTEQRESGRRVGGFAQVRFEHGGRTLIAESTHWGKQSDEALNGFEIENIHTFQEDAQQVESFELKAHMDWMSGEYEITSIKVDGEEFSIHDDGMVELAFGIFHSRSYEIACLSKEQEDAKHAAHFEKRSEIIKENMPRIFFGDHLLAFSSDIQGVA